ncbi:RNA polymerase sigma-70 factor, ECF subfamily [Chitinophaga rupis]|uniref:RNA polymerase sigma-70 factor, ECF subfamily n=1 Tax=Chitinophaga rupis TaxID=573321 RepID=A0A1H7LLI8_9BACT|nr:RNA polymerase sigma factor [Chitinophaga rupis]SEK99790.1 RNA polymerase sigma-70 factor, ECF subfamily [Chitinophaga rupis]
MSPAEFTDLLLLQGDFLKPFAIALTRDSEAARDLYQETMYRALLHREKYTEGTNIRAWLFTIMRNLFINHYRRKVKQQLFLERATRALVLLHQPYVDNQAITSMQVKDIQHAIYRLPNLFKRPFLLYYEGFKYYEIADMLHEPMGTIKSRIHFARKMLKQQIAH